MFLVLSPPSCRLSSCFRTAAADADRMNYAAGAHRRLH